MAEYGFECRNCKNTFTLFIRVTERMKAGQRSPRPPLVCPSRGRSKRRHVPLSHPSRRSGIVNVNVEPTPT
jgi:hypothetical protein